MGTSVKNMKATMMKIRFNGVADSSED